jgi:hypothetical protein
VEVSQPALEHGSSRSGRWVRQRRLQLGIWIAIAEGAFVVFGVIPPLAALVVAGVLIVLYVLAARRLPYAARQAAWVVAFSQVIVASIPLLVLVIGALALFALFVIAAIALVVLLADRR